MHISRNSRETWVDTVKVLACILVAVGHFVQSMAKANIIDSSVTYIWFNRTIYYFHVPLFFICSGYLYQLGKPVNTGKEWGRNVLKKLIALGIPYLLFSTANWLLKTMFASNVNVQAGGLMDTLFVDPSAPYWYLYTLFFVFLVTPTINSKVMACILAAFALGAKLVSLTVGGLGLYALNSLASYWIWFVLGMILAYIKAPKTLRKQVGVRRIALVIAVLFFAGSIAVVVRNVSSGILTFLFGIFGCSAIIALAITAKYTDKSRKIILWLSDYTMPVYLMHTIFAAGLRSVLFKLGINHAIVHILLGLTISFAGPILVGIVLKKLKWAEFILYPGKFIKFSSKKEVSSHGEKA